MTARWWWREVKGLGGSQRKTNGVGGAGSGDGMKREEEEQARKKYLNVCGAA